MAERSTTSGLKAGTIARRNLEQQIRYMLSIKYKPEQILKIVERVFRDEGVMK